MKYLFEIKQTISVDSDLFKNLYDEQKARQLIADGYGHIVDEKVTLVEISGE